MSDGVGMLTARLLLRLASALVPSGRRRSWLREWRAELEAAGRRGRSPLGMAAGAVPDAWAVRRLASDGRARGHREREGTGTMKSNAKGRTQESGGAGAATTVIRELRRALRSLFRAPGFTAASVLTLMVGLGGTAAIVTLVDGILLRPLPYPEADRVVRVQQTYDGSGGGNPFARFAYPLLEEANHSFEALGGYWSPARYTLAGETAAERIVGVQATVGLLAVLGARPVAGRLFHDDDAGREDEAGVVLSHRLWERRYGADPSLVGRSVEIDGRPREVLGVMAPGVDLPQQKVDLWIPYAVPVGVRADDSFRIHVLARLRPGVDVAAARADVQALVRRFPEFAPFYQTYIDEIGLAGDVRSVRDEVVGDVEGPLWILLGAVFIVLLVAAANVATLFLVRAEARRQEVAVRSALGAGRRDLIGHFLSESAWVAAAAGAGGLFLAWGAVRLFVSLAPPMIPRLDELRLALPTVAVVVTLAAAIAVALGVYPFVRFGRGGPRAPGGRVAGGTRAQGSVGSGLVVVQVALALTLLSGAALLLRTYQALRAVDPGFEPEGVVMADFSLPATAYPSPDEVRIFKDRLLDEAAALPGVRSVALGPSPLGLGGGNGLFVEGVEIPEGQMPPVVPIAFVTAGYWETLGIQVAVGRAFSGADDDPDAPPVAVVTEGIAAQLWPDQDPLTGAVRPTPRRGPPWFRVVGVTEPVHGRGPDQPPTEAVYLPAGAMDAEGWLERSATLLVKTTPGGEADLVPSLRRIVADLDPSVPLTYSGSLVEAQAGTMIRQSFTLFLLGTASATALILGLVGLYGVVAYRVGTRQAEIGVRMAMGARAGQVRTLVLGHSLRLVAAGTVLGLVASVLGTRVLSSLLFGVAPGDPLMLGAAAAALAVTAAAASWIPARRASRLDPATVLRDQG